MNRKTAIVAQFIKSAAKIATDKKISGKTSLVKMVCFAELERGLKTGFVFKPNYYGLYDEEIIRITKELEKNGLIQTEYKEEPHPQFLFKAAPKLLKLDTGLSEKEIKIVENTLNEYWRMGNKELSVYCKQMYIEKNKKRIDKEIRELRLKEDNKTIELAKAVKLPEWWKSAPTK